MLTLPAATTSHGVDDAAEILADKRIAVLTGAGLSTDSGIPDYRGPHAQVRQPMTIATFRSGLTARRRYWARSHVGWLRMQAARPNDGHRALARLQANGVVTTVITQNVDGLHSAAGSTPVIDLHGRLRDVICLDCRNISLRLDLHARLTELNPRFAEDLAVQVRPDGDVELTDVDSFQVADCLSCGGPLKPDVVFFGENVPKERVAHCYALVERADALLVAGTSLAVQSGLRFVRRAHQHGTPIVLVNRGATRGDPLVTVRVEAGCSQLLSALADVLDDPAAAGTTDHPSCRAASAGPTLKPVNRTCKPGRLGAQQ